MRGNLYERVRIKIGRLFAVHIDETEIKNFKRETNLVSLLKKILCYIFAWRKFFLTLYFNNFFFCVIQKNLFLFHVICEYYSCEIQHSA